jgi:hypothetical protein
VLAQRSRDSFAVGVADANVCAAFGQLPLGGRFLDLQRVYVAVGFSTTPP